MIDDSRYTKPPKPKPEDLKPKIIDRSKINSNWDENIFSKLKQIQTSDLSIKSKNVKSFVDRKTKSTWNNNDLKISHPPLFSTSDSRPIEVISK